jgi:hypothetical protein
MKFETIQNGYSGLARVMGPNYDQGLDIFRQFAELNARNLLYMQAEIICLWKELDGLTHIDEKGPNLEPQKFARNVWAMRAARPNAQWDKILEIREKLSTYSK